jgi:hypothetical protein
LSPPHFQGPAEKQALFYSPDLLRLPPAACRASRHSGELALDLLGEPESRKKQAGCRIKSGMTKQIQYPALRTSAVQQFSTCRFFSLYAIDGGEGRGEAAVRVELFELVRMAQLV